MFFLENLPRLEVVSDAESEAAESEPAEETGAAGAGAQADAEDLGSPTDAPRRPEVAGSANAAPNPAGPDAAHRTTASEGRRRPPAPQPSGDDDLDDFGGGFAKPAPPVDEYRLRCEVCDSVMWVRASQSGTVVQCSDCFSELTVPPPPPKPPVRPARADDDDDDDPLPPIVDARLETATSDTTVQSDSNFQQRTVQDYLREAEAAEPEEDYRTMYDNPDFAGWFRGTAKMFIDPGVLAHLFVFGLVFTAFFWVFLTGESTSGLQIIASVFALLLFVGVILSGMAVLIASANDHPYVSEWPLASPAEAMGEMLVAVGSYAIAAVPGLVLCSVIGFNLLGVAGLMLGLFILWPFVLLSMLDNNTPFNPYSSDVARSLQRAPDAWGVFYTSSGVLFGILFFAFLAAGMIPVSIGAPLCGFGLTLVIFLYFRLMGQLAQGIGNVVNVPEDPDSAGEIEQ